jgi:hypothetical protein
MKNIYDTLRGIAVVVSMCTVGVVVCAVIIVAEKIRMIKKVRVKN